MRYRRCVLTILLLISPACTVNQGAVFEVDGPERMLIVERQPAHTLLAEYHRALVLRIDGEERARVPMAVDSGGYSRANLYRLGDGQLLVTDFDASYRVDTSAWTVERAEARLVDGHFLGSFDEDDSGDWVFIGAERRHELPTAPRGSGP